MYTYTYIHTYIYIYTHTHTHNIYIYIHIHTYIILYIYTLKEETFAKVYSRKILKKRRYPRNFLKKSSSANILKKNTLSVVIYIIKLLRHS